MNEQEKTRFFELVAKAQVAGPGVGGTSLTMDELTELGALGQLARAGAPPDQPEHRILAEAEQRAIMEACLRNVLRTVEVAAKLVPEVVKTVLVAIAAMR